MTDLVLRFSLLANTVFIGILLMPLKPDPTADSAIIMEPVKIVKKCPPCPSPESEKKRWPPFSEFTKK